MQGIWSVVACSFLLAGCGTESSTTAPAVDPAPSDPSGPPPSIADWMPEGHSAPPAGDAPSHGGALPPGHPPVAGYGAPSAAEAPPPDAITGTVRETMDAASYTYMRLETERGMVWVAANRTPVSLGDRVVAAGSVMHGFRSSTLDRTFDELVLASYVRVDRASER